jgi:hypothetical protein
VYLPTSASSDNTCCFQTCRVLEQLQAIHGRRSRPTSFLTDDSAVYDLKRELPAANESAVITAGQPNTLPASHDVSDTSQLTDRTAAV